MNIVDKMIDNCLDRCRMGADEKTNEKRPINEVCVISSHPDWSDRNISPHLPCVQKIKEDRPISSFAFSDHISEPCL